MKELSIEEKAKAYDKVREKIALRFGSNVAEEIFSEFEESEDERIRKALIKAIKMKAFPTSTCGGELFICGQSSDKCITWLEKQGKQKDILEDAILDSNEDGLIAETIGVKQGEHNSAWSEEDEINYNYALAACKYYGEAKGYADTETHQKANNWLKSIKERMQPQSDWSEDDKNMSRFIGNAITADGASEYLESKGIQVIDAHVWLDELKDRVQPQNTWKPSDVQMKQLGWVAEQNKDNMIGKELMSLYKDLKKLKG